MSSRLLASLAVPLIALVGASPAVRATEIPFLTEHPVETTDRSDWLDAGDVDGDGDLDLVTANCAGDTFTLWRNGGGAVAWTGVVIDSVTADCPRMIRFADLDADGDLDAIGAASASSGSVLWFENSAGDGSSWTTHTVVSGTGFAYWVEAADIDADGDLDLAATLGNRIVWWSNEGGSWTEHAVADGFLNARSASPVDVDGDGDLDLIGTSFTGDEIAWWRNDGACAPACSWPKTVIGSLDEANTVAPADLDGDGDLDVVVGGHASAVVAWWENTAGTGTAWTGHALSTTASLSWAVATADLDSDGDLDVVGTSIANHDVLWWENDGSACSPSCAWPQRAIDGSFVFAEAVAIADLDQDGDLDVAGGAQSAGIAWWENETLHRSGLFDIGNVVTQQFSQATWVGAIDLDNDADLDLVVGTYASGLLVIYNASATTTPVWSAVQTIGAVSEVTAAALGDVDVDGFADVVATLYGEDDVIWFRNPGAAGGSWTSSTVEGAFDGAFGLGLADLDADGDLDIVGAALTDGVSWFENDALSWTEHGIDATMAGAHGVASGDIDGDGDLDVLGAANLANKLRWWANDGGSPPAWTAHEIEDGPFKDAVLVDFDADGDLDAVASGNDVGWWENADGAGTTWVTHLAAELVLNIELVHAVDVDADGDLDIVGARLSNATWWENSSGDGVGWIEHTLPGEMQGGWTTSVGDIDRDGLVDVFGATWGESEMWWWPNQGGQFALPTVDAVVSDHPTEDTEVAVLAIDFEHRGRAGDDDAELATLELLFEASPATPLSGAELAALVADVTLYRDDGDGSWDAGDAAVHSIAPPYTLTAGVLSLALPDDDADLQVSNGAVRTYFLTLRLAADAGTAVPDTLVVTHLTESSSTAEMASTDLPLTPEHSADTTATALEVNAAPVVDAPIGDQVAIEGHNPLLEVSAAFSDPEGDTLTFSAGGLPSSLSISPAGVITGTPTASDAASSPYSVTVLAEDVWGGSVDDTFSLTILPALVFDDGFESGNTTAWSATVP